MIRTCNGTDEYSQDEDRKPCRCGLRYDDVRRTTIFPHSHVGGTAFLPDAETFAGREQVHPGDGIVKTGVEAKVGEDATLTSGIWNVTAYRDSKGREWALRSHGRWYSPTPVSRDDLINGFADCRFDSLDELVVARGCLTPLAVDNVESLLATHYATCDQFEWYVEGAIEAAEDARDEIAALTSVVDAVRVLADSALASTAPRTPAFQRVLDAVAAFEARTGHPQRHAGAPGTVWVGDATSTPTSTPPELPDGYRVVSLNHLTDDEWVAAVASLDESKDGTDG